LLNYNTDEGCVGIADSGDTWADQGALVTGNWSVQDDVDCNGFTGDVVSFPLVAGDTVSFSIDTVDAASAFDSIAHVNGPDTCTLLEFDENVECSYNITYAYDYDSDGLVEPCGAGTFTADADGTYEIVVNAYPWGAFLSSCEPGATAGNYDLQIDAPNLAVAPTLTDDAQYWDLTRHVTREYTLSADITRVP
ncbi:MAG: hypothetical protein ABMA64_33020, partial [Myxococcota bacterium]